MPAPQRGEFPFPLTDAEREAPAVTWIRNNSSYLNLSGALNVLQALATYVRGVIGNLIILSPVFILLGTVLGLAHFYMLDNPFVITRWTLVVALVLTVGFFALRSSDSSFSETSKVAGILAMLLSIVAVIEASPFVIEYFRDSGSAYFDVFGLKEAVSLIVSLATGAGVIVKFLPAQQTLRRGIMLGALGVFGFILAWLVLLLVANYVCYGLPPYDYTILVPLVAVLAFFGCVGLYIAKSPALSRLTRAIAFAIVVAICCGLYAYSSTIFTGFIVRYSDDAGQYIGTITHPLKQLVDGAAASIQVESALNSQEPAVDSEAIGEKLAHTLEELKLKIQGLELQATAKDALQFEAEHPAYQLGAPDVDRPFPLKPKYFESAAVFLEDAQDSLGALDQINRANLLMRLADHARLILRERGVKQSSREGLRKRTDGSTEEASDCDGPPMAGISTAKLEDWTRDRIRTEIAIYATQRFVESRIRADSLSTSLWLNDRKPVEDSNDFLSEKGMKEFLKGLRINILHHDSFQAVFKEEENSKANWNIPYLAGWGRMPKKNLVQTVWLFEQQPTKDGKEAEGLDMRIATLVQKYRAYIFARAVLNVLPVEDARSYLDSIVARAEERNKDANSADDEKDKAGKLYCKASLQHLTSIVNARDPRFSTALLRAAVVGTSVAKSAEMKSFLQTLPIRTEMKANRVNEIRNAARDALFEIAISDRQPVERRHDAVQVLGEAFDPQVPPLSKILGEVEDDKSGTAIKLHGHEPGSDFAPEQLYSLIARSFVIGDHTQAEYVMRRMVFGKYGNLEGLNSMNQELYSHTLLPKLLLILPLLACLTIISISFIGANSTSIHGYYRNRLANVFKLDPDMNVAPSEEDREQKAKTRLSDLSDRRYGSYAPYHLINAAINMSLSGEDDIRNRNADFFLFSKLFVGGKYTGYIRTEQFEEVASELTVGGAMAISGAAASSNMGKYSNGVLNFFLCLLNIRLGYWLPNPKKRGAAFEFEHVFVEELRDIAKRRDCEAKEELGRKTRGPRKKKEDSDRRVELGVSENSNPTVQNELVGVALSGGGIRSAAFNMGVLQHLDACSFFREVDILSSVSGGGYIATAVSTFMRRRTTNPTSRGVSENRPAEQLPEEQTQKKRGGLWQRFVWMPRSFLLFLEMFSFVNHRWWWVNISDGGHIENLGLVELLRRRCKLIVVGDGEADPEGVFDGLSCAKRIGEIDLGVKILFPHGSLDFARKKENWDTCEPNTSKDVEVTEKSNERCKHFALGRIEYPARSEKELAETGYIIYLKSSFRGNEDLILRNYKQVNEAFPHESTVDQLFDESQFEAYRRLGELISKEAFDSLSGGKDAYYYRICEELENRFKQG